MYDVVRVRRRTYDVDRDIRHRMHPRPAGVLRRHILLLECAYDVMKSSYVQITMSYVYRMRCRMSWTAHRTLCRTSANPVELLL